MRRIPFTFAALVLGLSVSAFTGCDSGTKVEDIQISPEAKAADTSGQKGMEEFMKSKGAPKAGASKGAAVAPH